MLRTYKMTKKILPEDFLKKKDLRNPKKDVKRLFKLNN